MSAAQATTQFIEIDGIRIAESVIGEGRPILMLHGWGSNLQLIWPLANRLAPMGYRIYMVDLPGFGESSALRSAWTVHDYVHFVLAYMDTHRLERIYLFGHSFGGSLSLILGAEHADRFHKMVLADASGVRPKPPLTSQLRLKLYKSIRDGLKTIGLGNLSEQLRQQYNARYGSPDFQAASGVMRETIVKVVNEDLRPYAERVKVSTLLLWGDQDQDTPLWHGQLLEKAIPDAGLVVFKGAGHYSYLDNLAEALRIIDYFFKQV